MNSRKKRYQKASFFPSFGLQSLGAMAGLTGAAAKDAIRRRIYVGNIYYEIKEPELRSVFSPFGTITTVEMSNDPL